MSAYQRIQCRESRWMFRMIAESARIRPMVPFGLLASCCRLSSAAFTRVTCPTKRRVATEASERVLARADERANRITLRERAPARASMSSRFVSPRVSVPLDDEKPIHERDARARTRRSAGLGSPAPNAPSVPFDRCSCAASSLTFSMIAGNSFVATAASPPSDFVIDLLAARESCRRSPPGAAARCRCSGRRPGRRSDAAARTWTRVSRRICGCARLRARSAGSRAGCSARRSAAESATSATRPTFWPSSQTSVPRMTPRAASVVT